MALLLCGVVTQGAHAQIASWVLIKTKIHPQVLNNTPPGAPIAWGIDSSMQVVSSSDYSAVTLNSVHAYNLNTFLFGILKWTFTNTYPDKASIDADFPLNSSVVVSATGNTQPSVSQAIPLGTENFTPVPYLLGTSFDDLQSMDASSPLTITFQSPDVFGLFGGTIVIMEDPTNLNIVVSTKSIGFIQSSKTLESNLLKPGTSYRLAIRYNKNTVSPADPAGLNTTTHVGYESVTVIDFSTATGNPDLNGDGIVDGADLGLLLGAWGTSP